MKNYKHFIYMGLGVVAIYVVAKTFPALSNKITENDIAMNKGLQDLPEPQNLKEWFNYGVSGLKILLSSLPHTAGMFGESLLAVISAETLFSGIVRKESSLVEIIKALTK